MMKRVAISQSNYIPWKGFFESIRTVDEFILYDEVQYTRRDWRNRNRIKTPNGPEWLTIPVEVKGKYHQKIRETKISDPNWGLSHWKSIAQNYTKATYFKEYKDLLENLYRTCTTPYLSEVNFNFLSALCVSLGVTTPLRWSDEIPNRTVDLIFRRFQGGQAAPDPTDRLVDICVQTGATDYYSGPAAKAYMDEGKFSERGIRVHYFDYGGYPEYRQLHGPFVHEVSMIDLLLNEGPRAAEFFVRG